MDNERGQSDPTGPSPSAAAAFAALSYASREKADTFLEEQSRLAREQAEVSAKQGRLLDLQIDTLQKADEFENSHLRWRRFNEWMGGALQILLVLVGLAIVAGLGAALWSAASDNGLVIEAFSVPPDLAAKGLTGEVIANKVLDRLALLQAQTASGRTSASYANNWGDDIKVQIPNTGVSIGEFNRALHQWLGHATHISGEVYRTPTGIAVSARVGTFSTPIFTGAESGIDALVNQVAEQVYRSTQPYRYATWLFVHGHSPDKAAAVLQTIIADGSPLERGWAYNGMASIALHAAGDEAGAAEYARKALESDSHLLLPRTNFIGSEFDLGHDEAVLRSAPALAATVAEGDPTLKDVTRAQVVPHAQARIAMSAGDNAAALAAARKALATGDTEYGPQYAAIACALLHDEACMRASWAMLPATTDPENLRDSAIQRMNAARGRWDALLAGAPGFHAARMRALKAAQADSALFDSPLWALAAAHHGDFATAHRQIDATPLDCIYCLRVRGQVDALAHNWSGAASWFARAQAAAPSSPLVATDWGEMLLHKGDFDAAIVRFDLAHQKGPNFADPLEMWGEALIAKNRSDLALAKFEEAAKDAPNWGRLHLKWGEALLWSGDKDGAQKQFATASALFLTPSEQTDLARLGTAHG